MLLGEAEQRAEELHLSPKERKELSQRRAKEAERERKAQQKAKSQAANRTLLYLPADLRDALADIAEREGVPVSQLATYFLYESLRTYRSGGMNLSEDKVASRSPRYSSNLIHPQDAERRAKLGGK
jgi:hypothetical protein